MSTTAELIVVITLLHAILSHGVSDMLGGALRLVIHTTEIVGDGLLEPKLADMFSVGCKGALQ